MRALDLDSERYSPRGNMSAQGLGRALGAPSIDRLRLLVRETVQNSWDARLQGQAPLYRFQLRCLTPEQRCFLGSKVLAVLPQDPDDRELIRSVLDRDDLSVFEINDHGTKGLGGAVRAHLASPVGEATDFADFMRNMGSPRDVTGAGGTYGYGKASLFLASQCRTILVHTHCRTGERRHSRFMGFHLGRVFSADVDGSRCKFTGRHWWGRLADDAIADPAVGDEADELARQLGMRQRQTNDLGTSIIVIAPDLQGKTGDQVASTVTETLLWSFWPKMLGCEEAPEAMRFEVLLDGRSVSIPSPGSFPPLPCYIEAMRSLKGGDVPCTGRTIECRSPSRRLGRLFVSRRPIQGRECLDTGDAETEIIPIISHHVALMRPAELVVKYLPGPLPPVEGVEYGGVFICDGDRAVEGAFAAAEPPAHDDWCPENLPARSHERTYVSVALRRIKEELKRLFEPTTPPLPRDDVQTPLAGIATFLGGLLPAVTPIGGAGPGRNPGKGPRGPGGGRQGIKIRGLQHASIEDRDGELVSSFTFEVLNESGSGTCLLTAVPSVVLDDGTLIEIPVADRAPEIAGWILPDGTRLPGEKAIYVEGSHHGEFTVEVSVSGSYMVAVELAADAELRPEGEE